MAPVGNVDQWRSRLWRFFAVRSGGGLTSAPRSLQGYSCTRVRVAREIPPAHSYVASSVPSGCMR